jgi:toxin ParE1/3/4
LKVTWTARATIEREQQLEYIGERNMRAAQRLRNEIDAQFQLIAEQPFSARRSRVHGLRELVISRTPYLAYYRVGSDAVVVLRFFHTAQRRSGWRRR